MDEEVVKEHNRSFIDRLFKRNKNLPKIIGSTRVRDTAIILKKDSAQSAKSILGSNNYPVTDAGPSTDGVSDIIHFKVTDDADEANARALLREYILLSDNPIL
jgi:hypothetical protein